MSVLYFPHAHASVLATQVQAAHTMPHPTLSLAPLLMPAVNGWTRGKVIAHHLSTHIVFSPPLFIIGDDPDSIAWARAHAEHLRHIHALGVLVQMTTLDRLAALMQQLDLPLITAQLAGLAAVLHTTHYPLWVQGQWVRP